MNNLETPFYDKFEEIIGKHFAEYHLAMTVENNKKLMDKSIRLIINAHKISVRTIVCEALIDEIEHVPYEPLTVTSDYIVERIAALEKFKTTQSN